MAIYGDEKHNENMVHEEPAFQEIIDECTDHLQSALNALTFVANATKPFAGDEYQRDLGKLFVTLEDLKLTLELGDYYEQ